MYVTPRKLEKNKHNYCSLGCRSTHYYGGVSGKDHWNWKGGITKIGEYVYVIAKEHPRKNSGGYVAEHRLVMETTLGRYLTPNEEVHHRNGIKDDNRIENLEIVVREMHFGEVVCPYCLKEFKVK